MPVITISRQLGSLGCQVASEIAACLNYRVVWREVINQAALRSGEPEVALATIDDLDLLGIRPSAESRIAYHNAVKDIMHELYREGNVVIVGRAGQAILANKEDVFHVRIYAPVEVRVLRVKERFQLSEEQAKAQIQASDDSRVRYLKKYYKMRWDDPCMYDLMINTARLPATTAAAIVCESVRQFSLLH